MEKSIGDVRNGKIDIDKEFRAIISRFGYNGIHDIKTDIYIKVEQLLLDVCNTYQNIAIRCGGYHTAHLLEEFGDILNVKFIIDRNRHEVQPYVASYKIPIIEKITKEQIDAIIISTFDYRREIKEELNGLNVKVIDIYDYLEQAGYHLSEEFYNAGRDKKLYKRLIEGNQRYKSAISQADKEETLNDLIGMYLDDRDIYAAMKCINEYVDCRYNGYIEKKEMLRQIGDLLQKIKCACQERTHKDILWFWQDGMFYRSIEDMPHLKERSEQGIFFKKAYSITSSTRHVYSRVLDLRSEFEMYCEAGIRPRKHLTIEMLNSHGYSCRKIVGVKRHPISLDTLDIYNMRRLIIVDSTLTEVYWEALREILLSETPMFLLLHTGLETHMPAMAPNLDYYCDYDVVDLAERFEDTGRKKFWDRMTKTVQYVDVEMNFFFELLGNNSVKIVMSDHGDALTQNSYCFTDDWSHIMLMAVGGNLPTKKYERLFDIMNFKELLKYILEEGKSGEDNLLSDEILFNMVDIYGEQYIKDLISIGFAYSGIAFCGVMTEEDRFVKFATGEEVYNIFPDEFTNYIKQDSYQERIAYLRERAGTHFIDNKKNKKFSKSHLLYEAIGKERIY